MLEYCTINLRVFPFCKYAKKEQRLPWEFGLYQLKHFLHSDTSRSTPKLRVFVKDVFEWRLYVLGFNEKENQ